MNLLVVYTDNVERKCKRVCENFVPIA